MRGAALLEEGEGPERGVAGLSAQPAHSERTPISVAPELLAQAVAFVVERFRIPPVLLPAAEVTAETAISRFGVEVRNQCLRPLRNPLPGSEQ
jgi:hypothetical protein